MQEACQIYYLYYFSWLACIRERDIFAAPCNSPSHINAIVTDAALEGAIHTTYGIGMSEKSHSADDDAGHEDSGKGKSKLKLIIILVAALLLIGGGAGLYMSGILFSKSAPAEAHAEGADAAHGADSAAHGDAAHGDGHGGDATASGGATANVGSAVFYDLPDFLVNLNSGTNKSSFLKVSVTLELANAEGIQQVEAMKPRIVDSFQTYLRELRPGDLKGSAGIYRLREELLLRVNKTVQPAQVNDILFREMIVQ